ncbi:MAG: endo-1,4-beta-xylanase [Geminicoccaceae bacterium]
MMTRRQFVHSGQALAFAGLPFWPGRAMNNCADKARKSVEPAPLLPAPPLKIQARQLGKMFGSAADRDLLSADADYRAVLIEECSMITPENSMKWERLRPDPDRFFFDDADWLVDFAADHDLSIRGHTLAWHLQLPAWLDQVMDHGNAEKILINHIETVAGRYAGRIHSWDVANEIIAVEHGRSDGLRLTPWLNYLGPDHVDLAFRTAAAADPDAILVYNEIGLEYGDETGWIKRQHVLDLLSGLVAKGTPVQALGLQAHLSAESPPDFKSLDQFLRDVADLGLDVMITELDVSDQTLPKDIEVRDCMVAEIYRAFLDVVIAHDHVISITVWGLSDRYSWLTEFGQREDGEPTRPSPLDHEFNKKPAWHAISETFASAGRR